MPLLMVFIDGLGLGLDNPAVNPLASAEMPWIKQLLSGKPLSAAAIGDGIESRLLVIKPTDACLNTAGLPQSATGQTALFTGLNAAALAGRHINGFPTRRLREIIGEASIFKAINQGGGRAVFANTFTDQYFQSVERGKWRHSVTTTAAMAGKCHLLMPPDLLRGEAVFQDITNEQLRERGYDIPLFEPEQAAANLTSQAVRNDFTLFEYFQTDRCGHRQDWDLARTLLNRLDRFLAALSGCLAKNQLTLLVTSDHGNIEDLTVKTHTLNPVPTMAVGSQALNFKDIRSLVDIYPAVLRSCSK